MKRFRVLTAGLLAAGFVALSWAGSAGAQDKNGSDKASAPDKAAIDRARLEAKMLDDLYKTAVVKITQVYVGQQGEVPAAVAAAEIFHAMKEKGWHNARLVDASGKPKRKANLPETDFEKKAVEAMKSGKTYYEEVGQANGKPVLRAATVVPAVMKECAACHKVKMGDLLGTIVYEIPIRK